MDKDFFIMINSQNNEYIIPMTDNNNDVALFETYNKAKEIADTHPMCCAFGYEIFRRGCGE